MHDTTERVKRVKLRVGKLQRASGSRLINALSALCIILSLFLVGAIGAMTGGSPGTVSGLYGTILKLKYEDAGGYVLVGVIAFAVAVIITTLCLRYRENIKKSKKHKP
jgi:hypothetical protein